MKYGILICLMICLCILAVPAMAETVNGSLTLSSVTSLSDTIAQVGGGFSGNFKFIRVHNIEYWNGITALIRYDNVGHMASYSGGTGSGQTPCVIYVNSVFVATGVIGYQRLYDPITLVETNGYQYIIFDTNVNITPLSGNKDITLTYDQTEVDDMSFASTGTVAYPTGNGIWSPMVFDVPNWKCQPGIYQVNRNMLYNNDYSASKPAGLGIAGTVTKKVSGVNSSTLSIIYDGTTNAILTSQSGVTIDDFYFSVVADSIRIGMYTIAGQTNSSLIFTPAAAGLLPAGYVRTTVHAIDAVTGGQILGATINLRDCQNNSWKNSTADADGQLYIDVTLGHTIDIYGSYPGVYTASQELGTSTGGDYYLPMYLPALAAPFGYTNLYVYVREAGSLSAIENAQVTIKYPGGSTASENTGASGTASFIVPNSTVIITGTAALGYNSQSQSNSIPNTGVDYFITVTMSKDLGRFGMVTPTVTDPSSGLPITAVPTVDARTAPEKDADMMNQLRDSGPGLISLCILAMIFGLFKMIMK